MACTHPRLMAVASIYSTFDENGVGVVDPHMISRMKKLNWKVNLETGKAYRLVAKDSREHELEKIGEWKNMKVLEIPCGGCVQCRLDYSKTWATRCYYESLQYKHNYFVTLTYDDDHILRSAKSDNPTVYFPDAQQFIKSLRQKFKRDFNHVGVRYFGCTEYGDQSFRPHIHLILFNCPIPDLTLDFKDEDGNITRRSSKYGFMYYSQFIKDLWPYGFITVEDANYNTEAYVSRYIMKKQKGKAGTELYDKLLDVEAPRLFMSLKPAIGAKFFEDNENYLIDSPVLIVPRDHKEPLLTGIPRFYKKKILDNHPDMYYEMLNKAKENSLKSRSLIAGKSTMNQQREIQEDHVKRSFEAFSRDL